MDNDKTFKRKSITLIAKNLILLLSVAVTGVIGAWSWFTSTTKATADGISVKCEAPDGIEIAVVKHGADAPSAIEYSKELLLDSSCDIIKDLNLTEVTSDGVVFQKPKLEQINGVAKPIEGVDWEKAFEGRDYMSFDLYIRSEDDLNIYLDSESSMLTSAKNLIGSDCDSKSDKGDFSKDCIVGASRVSVIDSDQNKTRRLLWIPRPDFYLQEDKDNKTFNMTTNVVSGTTDVHNYWTVKNGTVVQKLTKDNEAVASTRISDENTFKLNQDIFVTKLGPTKQDDGYYYGYITYYMWVEGEDTEARLALAGGSFNMNLRIAGKEDSDSE